MKKTLQIDELNAKRLYKESSAEFKATLEDTFGKEFFFTKIQDRVKTFEDACNMLGLDPVKILPDVSFLPEEDKKPTIAQLKLGIIARVLNEGWKPNWNNSTEKKWYPWFDMRSGGSFVDANYDYWFSPSGVGSRLCFKNQELAEYAGRQFGELYKDLMGV